MFLLTVVSNHSKNIIFFLFSCFHQLYLEWLQLIKQDKTAILIIMNLHKSDGTFNFDITTSSFYQICQASCAFHCYIYALKMDFKLHFLYNYRIICIITQQLYLKFWIYNHILVFLIAISKMSSVSICISKEKQIVFIT